MSSYMKMSIEAVRARDTPRDGMILDTRVRSGVSVRQGKVQEGCYGRIRLGCLITHSTLGWGKPHMGKDALVRT